MSFFGNEKKLTVVGFTENNKAIGKSTDGEQYYISTALSLNKGDIILADVSKENNTAQLVKVEQYEMQAADEQSISSSKSWLKRHEIDNNHLGVIKPKWARQTTSQHHSNATYSIADAIKGGDNE